MFFSDFSASSPGSDPQDRTFSTTDAQALLSDDAPRDIHIKFTAFVRAQQYNSDNAPGHPTNKQGEREDNTGSQRLITIAKHIHHFLMTHFCIGPLLTSSQRQQAQTADLLSFRTRFVQRKVGKHITPEAACALPAAALITWAHRHFGHPFNEYQFLTQVNAWENKASEDPEAERLLRQSEAFCAVCLFHDAGKPFREEFLLFKTPQPLDFTNKALGAPCSKAGVYQHTSPHHRSDFSCTTPPPTAQDALHNAKLCLKCHPRQKDTCRTGLWESDGIVKKNPAGEALFGCPLGQKISEMHLLFEEGFLLGALAMIMRDNPLAPLTGLRICNDCEKSCIFQNQTQVDTPLSETHILDQVLALPWGVEIYLLLTRWNPLNEAAPLQTQPQTGPVLVVGSGPSAMSAAYHLLYQGTPIVMIEAMAMTPLPAHWLTAPIENYKDIWQPLDSRQPLGFGGVSEYGITSRWDKNKITLVRLALERHPAFRVHGGVRFGSQLTTTLAHQAGFVHIVMGTGAGKPSILPGGNALAPGVYPATDFLMTLQLAGAYLKNTPHHLTQSLEIQLPLIVIGGGLTAMDAATEALAYYPRFIEKIGTGWDALSSLTQQEIMENLPARSKVQLQRYLDHWHALAPARQTKEWPQILAKKLTEWGGVTLLYRKALTKAPSFRINPHEIKQALAQGIRIIEQTTIQEIICDAEGYVDGVSVLSGPEKTPASLPARTILTALGTHPNLKFLTEDPLYHNSGSALNIDPVTRTTVMQDDLDMTWPIVFQGQKTSVFLKAPPESPDFAGFISLSGDAHPHFSGSVVKALASGKAIAQQLKHRLMPHPLSAIDRAAFFEKCRDDYHPHIISCTHENGLTHLIIRAPAAARQTKPGHYFKIQSLAKDALHQPIFEKSLPLTAIPYPDDPDLLSFVFKSWGALSLQTKHIIPGMPLSLMGPAGSPFPLVHNEKVLIIATGSYATNLFSLGPALMTDNHVTAVVHMKTKKDLFWEVRFLKTAHHFQFEVGTPSLVQHIDHVMRNDVTALYLFAPPRDVMAFQQRLSLYPNLKNVFASSSGPLQCMLKEVCAHCLCPAKDPAQNPIFTCAQQFQRLHGETDQLGDKLGDQTVDYQVLSKRLSQNLIQDRITAALLQAQHSRP